VNRLEVTSAADELSSADRSAIASVMEAAGITLAGPLQAGLIAGGRSNLTFRLTDGERSWVLRMPPRRGRTPSAHDVAREYRVTAALRDTAVPVPPAVALCEDEALIGGPFAISEYVTGQTLQSRDQLEQLGAGAVTAVAGTLLETLAELHAVDHVAAGLERFGRPDAYAARQLRRWSGQWELVGTLELDGLAREVSAALGSAVPEQRAVGIVHGDFRVDNTLFDLADQTAPRVAAVVDWELSTIGDPVADVAMMCAYRHPVFDLIVGAPAAWTSALLPDVAGLAGAYERAGGVPLVGWERHLALAYFKVAVIAAGIDHRRREGSGSGPGFDTAGETVETYLELARCILTKRRRAPRRDP
jgi:aminoglycoside phosphotransferase (APT) family kinase protein